jgi:hypothetical protein
LKVPKIKKAGAVCRSLSGQLENHTAKIMVTNNRESKICDLPTDYCAFMVAMVLVRLVINKEYIGVQFKADEIAEIVNILPHSKSANFYVNPVALKHGMN